MTKILVLAGGDSDERTVSLRSGAAVVTALEAAGHQVTSYDPAAGLDPKLIATYDVVFPVLHGVGGEDGSLQQLLDDQRASYVGSGVAASKVCFNKAVYKQLLRDRGILTPAGTLVSPATFQKHQLAQAPFVLKPYDGGSSVDTFIIRDVAQADWPLMLQTVEKYGEMLLESLIVGSEITVGVLDEDALPVIEIIPPAAGEFDYENKYNGKTQELCPPLHVSQQLQEQARALAVKIHRLCGCRDFSRTDMLVTAAGELYVLETNTIPGMTDQSLLPKAAATAGITMPALVDELVTLAIARNIS